MQTSSGQDAVPLSSVYCRLSLHVSSRDYRSPTAVPPRSVSTGPAARLEEVNPGRLGPEATGYYRDDAIFRTVLYCTCVPPYAGVRCIARRMEPLALSERRTSTRRMLPTEAFCELCHTRSRLGTWCASLALVSLWRIPKARLQIRRGVLCSPPPGGRLQLRGTTVGVPLLLHYHYHT